MARLKAEVEAVGSAAFMIVTHGKIVAAWGKTERTYRTHSVRKSFMSALIGMAVAEGRSIPRTLGELGVTEEGNDADRSGEAGTSNRSAAGTLWHLPSGSSRGAGDARCASGSGSHAPGTFWYYNNWDFNVLGTIFGRPRERIF